MHWIGGKGVNRLSVSRGLLTDSARHTSGTVLTRLYGHPAMGAQMAQVTIGPAVP